MDNVVGKMLEGRYLIENLIGVGGMANVYHGFDTAENRPVAGGSATSPRPSIPWTIPTL